LGLQPWSACVLIKSKTYARHRPKDFEGAITASYTVSLSFSAVVSHSFAAHFFCRRLTSLDKRKSSFLSTAERMELALSSELYSYEKSRAA
jgi:hypothetical protein